MDVTLATLCDTTFQRGGMDESIARDKTPAGSCENIVSNERTVLGGGGMELTMTQQAHLDESADSVFDNSMLAEFKENLAAQGASGRPNTAELIASLNTIHHPSVAELPGSLPPSADNSIDYGATATVKFSGLALANNTLLLPRKESDENEEDGMTRCPVQFFSYDPAKPIISEQGRDNIGWDDKMSRSIFQL